MWILSFIWKLLLGSKIARVTAAILLGLALIKGYGYKQQQVGKEKLVAESTKELEKLGAKSKASRTRVITDDKYFTKRMYEYCRDCK